MLQNTISAAVPVGVVIVISLALCDLQKYQQISLDQQNQHRSVHRVTGMVLNEDLCSTASACAQYYADLGQIDHSCPDKNGEGENLWAEWDTSFSPSDDDAAQNSSDAWYSEVVNYNYSEDWQPCCGHFSQMVWKSSTELGFGTGRNGTMTVGCALYVPPGNVEGEFEDNVFPPSTS